MTTVTTARADQVPTPTPQERLLSDPVAPFAGERSVVSERSGSIPQPTATPLPTPVAIDPSATPLPPPPTPAPIPATPIVAAAPQAVAVPVTADGIWPVAGGGVSQYFSAGHPAVDIYANCLTPVIASYGGTITYSGWKNNGGGNVVAIAANAGFVIEFNHLSSVAFPANTYVDAGTVIGYIGATGLATGCHVHIAVNVGGTYVDPLAYF